MKEHKLGELLRYYRNRSNLTQQQVSDLMGINRTTYTYYETSKTEPSIDTLHKLIKIFGITYDDLLPTDSHNNANSEKSDETIYNLTKEEQQILLYYRVLSTEDKNKLKDNLGI